MLKYKIVYGEQHNSDFDDLLNEVIYMTTPNNVMPEDVAAVVSNIYKYVASHVYLYNKILGEYDDRDIDDFNQLKRKSLDIKSYMRIKKQLNTFYSIETED